MAKSLSKNLEKLLDRYSIIVIQKWAGNREFPYRILLGSWNKLGKGTTLKSAVIASLEKPHKDIEGEPFGMYGND